MIIRLDVVGRIGLSRELKGFGFCAERFGKPLEGLEQKSDMIGIK